MDSKTRSTAYWCSAIITNDLYNAKALFCWSGLKGESVWVKPIIGLGETYARSGTDDLPILNCYFLFCSIGDKEQVL